MYSRRCYYRRISLCMELIGISGDILRGFGIFFARHHVFMIFRVMLADMRISFEFLRNCVLVSLDLDVAAMDVEVADREELKRHEDAIVAVDCTGDLSLGVADELGVELRSLRQLPIYNLHNFLF